MPHVIVKLWPGKSEKQKRRSAKQMGAERIIAMSRHDARQKLAREFDATDIVTERGDEGVGRIKDLTNGIGADSVLEWVGTQESMMQAIKSTRPGGSVGYVGVPHGVTLDGADLFFRHVRFLGGPAPVRRYLPRLIDLVFAGKINPEKCSTSCCRSIKWPRAIGDGRAPCDQDAPPPIRSLDSVHQMDVHTAQWRADELRKIERPRRLVYLSSGMHRGGGASLRDIDWIERRWNASQAYSDSKLYVTALAFPVARCWPDVVSNAVDLGWVATKMGGPGAPDDFEMGYRTSHGWPSAMIPRRPSAAGTGTIGSRSSLDGKYRIPGFKTGSRPSSPN